MAAEIKDQRAHWNWYIFDMFVGAVGVSIIEWKTNQFNDNRWLKRLGRLRLDADLELFINEPLHA